MTPTTDELVKEFLETKHPWEHRYDIWQSFLASKQAKDWEVVSFGRSKSPRDEWVLEDGEYKYYRGFRWTFNQMMNDDCASVKSGEVYIKSVRRLIDHELFSIGEVTQEGKIEKFQIEDDKYMMVHVKEFSVRYAIQELHKLPERKPVLRTEDGIDKFKGDNCVTVDTLRDFLIGEWISLPEPLSCENTDLSGTKYFHTRSAAEEYVRDHKPEISRKMVKRALELVDLRPVFINDILNDLDKQLNP